MGHDPRSGGSPWGLLLVVVRELGTRSGIVGRNAQTGAHRVDEARQS